MTRLVRRALPLLVTLAQAAPTAAAPRLVAAAPDPSADGIAVVDLATRRVVKRLHAGPDPEAARPRAPVPSGGRRATPSPPPRSRPTPSARPARDRTLVATARSAGGRLWGLALSPDGRTLYAADGPAGALVTVDAESLSVTGRIPAGALPWGVVASE
jgi:YVTN family beta-propeller protein